MYIPTHLHSHYSIQDGLSQPKEIVERFVEIGTTAGALTDHGGVNGCVEFYKECKKASIKPILGCELYICQDSSLIRTAENRNLTHLVVLAKNLQGWKDLLRLTAYSNRRDVLYYKPRLSLEELKEYTWNLIAFSGHPGSHLADVLFTNPKLVYRCETVEDAQSLLDPDWENKATKLALYLQDIFGKGNFFIEIQGIDQERLVAAKVITNCLRQVAHKTGIAKVATPDAHYTTKERAKDQRVLLCSNLHTTFKKVQQAINQGDDVALGGFFQSSNYHVPDFSEMSAIHTEEELKNTLLIADMCESYNILNKPLLPKISSNAPEIFREKCREGWRKKVSGRISGADLPRYTDQIKHELDILINANLSDYFLIVEDYVRWAKGEGCYCDCRGSGGGSLAAYLLDLSSVDPMRYNLSFERFYNSGRNTAERTSLPDIDIDFEAKFIPKIHSYIENKYGSKRVASIATYGRLQGRGAIKEVLRAHDACSHEEMNKITEHIPDEAKISDQLEEMREAGEEPSVIRWALENRNSKLSEWCYLRDDGELDGPMSKLFEQAMRLEGVKKSQGKHAAGLIIADVDIETVAPMIQDKSSDKLMVGLDWKAAEEIGLPKMDILTLNMLDKLHLAVDMVAGKI